MATHNFLPVRGYTAQADERIDAVNFNKLLEERVLRQIDKLRDSTTLGVDQRWLAVGRTGIEQAFMAINRAVFQPQRIVLDEDHVPAAETPKE